MGPHAISAAPRRARWLSVLLSTMLLLIMGMAQIARADEEMERRIGELGGTLDAYVDAAMKSFDNPGLVLGIVTGDTLHFAKGYGVGRKGGDPVDQGTVFQIGSTTKAFLATTMAIAADRGRLEWDARVVDLDPDFQMRDSWVTSGFRVFDLLAQRSGLLPYANDILGMLGVDQAGMVRAMRFAEPVSSFRSTFAYTNVTHMLAQRIVARQFGEADWNTVLQKEIFDPLGMRDSSVTADAIEAAVNRSWGHRWTPEGTVEVPFTPIFPYGFGAAGAINSTVEDLARWVRLHLAGGMFEGKRLVSAENLAVTKTPRIGITDRVAYAMGWVIQDTPNGRIVWHNGGTLSYGAYIGMVPDRDVGVIVLTNEANIGLPDAVGEWLLDRLLGNAEVDHAANKLKAVLAAVATARSAAAVAPQPPTTLGPLAGDYVNDSFGEAKVMEDGGGLLLEISATGAKLKLADRGGQAFDVTLLPEGRFAAVAENMGPEPFGLVQFEAAMSGGVGGFTLAAGDNQQKYRFTRP